jgi:hypothetical protein
MHRLTLIALLFVMVAASACADAAPSSEATPEIQIEVTPEVIPEVTPETTAEASSVEWERYVQSDATTPGWAFQHPAGWEVVDLDGRNIFLYSTSGAGERLFVNGLQPGELVFQISMNPAANGDETPTAHLTVLSEQIRDAALGDVEPVTIAGLDGVRRRGTIDALGLTVVASSRPFAGGQFIDIIAYSRTDEFERNLSLMNAVIETVRYVLPTE